MPWFRLDDVFHSHPKVIAAGNEAVGLYVRCGTYAAEHLTDGFVPEHIAHLYGGLDVRRGSDETLVATLVRTRLWRRTRGGWRMPDYLDYNPSRQEVEIERKRAAERQARWREKKKARRNRSETQKPSREFDETDPVDNSAGVRPTGKRAGQNTSRRRVSHASRNALVTLPRPHPDPTPSGVGSGRGDTSPSETRADDGPCPHGADRPGLCALCRRGIEDTA